VAIDISKQALDVAKKNYNQLNLSNKINFLNEDIITIPTEKFNKKFDLIVANPPYIDKNSRAVQKSVEMHEPHVALFSKQEGFADIYAWTEKASAWLKSGGYYLMEFAHSQSQDIVSFLSQSDFFIEYSIYKDYADLNRYLMAKK